MPWTWQWLCGGLGVLAVGGLTLWAKDKLTHKDAPPAVVANYAAPASAELTPPPEAKTSTEPARTSVAPEPFPIPSYTPRAEKSGGKAEPASAAIVQTAGTDPTPTAAPPTAAPVRPGSRLYEGGSTVPIPEGIPVPPAPPPPGTVLVGCPWILKLEIGEGRSCLEARTESGIQMKLSCMKLTLRSPDGDIDASDNVVFTAGSLTGSCDHLTMSWRDSKISLSGKVRLMGKQAEQDVDLTGESLSFKLAPTAKANKRNEGSPVEPVAYPAPVPTTPPQPVTMPPGTPVPTVPVPAPPAAATTPSNPATSPSPVPPVSPPPAPSSDPPPAAGPQPLPPSGGLNPGMSQRRPARMPAVAESCAPSIGTPPPNLPKAAVASR